MIKLKWNVGPGSTAEIVSRLAAVDGVAGCFEGTQHAYFRIERDLTLEEVREAVSNVLGVSRGFANDIIELPSCR